MSLENEDPAGWRCPAPGCNREFGELWRLRQHYRQPAKGSTAATRGHGAELVECPRCKEPLSLLKNARHRCKLAPARLAAAAAAAATQARLAGGASQEGHVEDGPANKRRRVRWQGVSSGVSDSGGSSGDGSEEQELEECDAEDGKRPASGAAAVVAAAVAAAVAAEAEAAEPLPTLQARLPLPHPTPRSSTAAALLVRISSGAAGAMPSPLVPLQVLVPAPTNAACAPAPPALPVVQAAHAAAAPSSGIRWWQAAVQSELAAQVQAQVQAAAAAAPPASSSLQRSSPAAPSVLPQPAQAPPPSNILQGSGATAPASLLPELPLPPPAPAHFHHPPALPLAPPRPSSVPLPEPASASLAVGTAPMARAASAPLPQQALPAPTAHGQQLAPSGPLAALADELLRHLLELLQHAVGEAEAEGFVTLIVRHTADRQAGGRAGAGSGSLSQQAQQDSLLAALVAELTVRCTAVRQLLDQQRQRELAEGVRAALNAARLAAAVGQLSALLARQQAAGA